MVIVVAVAAAFGFAGDVANAQTATSKAATASAGNADAGKRAFTSAGCFACHGAQGQGTALGIEISPPPLELPALITYVRQPAGKMPPFAAGAVSDQQLGDIFVFLKSVAPAPTASESLPGSADNGKKLFVVYGCYECHGRQGAGASTGPRIGATALSQGAVIRYVRAPIGQMPPYTAKVVSDQDLADIYSFLKTFSPPSPAATIPLLNQ
jgi:mono/diheme cytochrome c family protein